MTTPASGLEGDRHAAGAPAGSRAAGRGTRPSGPAARARRTSLPVDARLVNIAAEHLARLGPQRVTVVAVAAEAGMTHANVYRYFPSKDALLDAVVARWLRTLETQLAGIADAPDPADDKLERLLTALARAQRDKSLRDPHVFTVHRDAAVTARPMARRHRSRLRTLVERVLEEGHAAGAFAVTDREQATAYVFDASFRFTHPLAIGHDMEVPDDLIDARLTVAIRAIQRALRAGFHGRE